VDAIAVVVPSVHGTVSDVSSSGFKVTTRDGSVWTITVDGSTEYQYGAGEGTLSDVTNGTTVVVLGESTGDNALTALTVRVAPDGAMGTVTSKTSDTIVITKRDGSTVTVHVDGDTTYRVGGIDSADLGDVAVDLTIHVTGRERADGRSTPTRRRRHRHGFSDKEVASSVVAGPRLARSGTDDGTASPSASPSSS
jgi:hypothetical protein